LLSEDVVVNPTGSLVAVWAGDATEKMTLPPRAIKRETNLGVKSIPELKEPMRLVGKRQGKLVGSRVPAGSCQLRQIDLNIFANRLKRTALRCHS
jgi:hypothetical protein